MVLSMTAFARKQSSIGQNLLVWEIRSVNHRYLETGFRFPEALRSLEPAVRDALRKTLTRGKVDCQLRIETEGAQDTSLQIDEALVVKLNNASGEVLHLTGGCNAHELTTVYRLLSTEGGTPLPLGHPGLVDTDLV